MENFIPPVDSLTSMDPLPTTALNVVNNTKHIYTLPKFGSRVPETELTYWLCHLTVW